MEAAGIATVVIGSGVFHSTLKAMKIPRTVLSGFPMGRTLGAPGDSTAQRTLILAALDLLEEASQGGTIKQIELPYRPVSTRHD